MVLIIRPIVFYLWRDSNQYDFKIYFVKKQDATHVVLVDSRKNTNEKYLPTRPPTTKGD